ncbi:unnamed protein product [Arabidopsis thaliana]|uniref:C3H1-type domain-containing protein n=1 Tax=Arabidopsis thaliana TaxID=3702 RepID=A0A5S9XUT5_ARATH|nr:unnamed protein product [Arabidopsis thaliana]
MCKFHHLSERETHVLETSLSSKGLPSRTGEPVCTLYFHTGNCSSGPTCIFDHPMLVSTHKNTSSMASETPHLNPLGLSSSLRALSSDIVEASTKKPRIYKNTSSVVSETPHSNPLRFSSPIGDSSSDLVETTTKETVINKNTPSMASETLHANPLRFSSSIGESSSD